MRAPLDLELARAYSTRGHLPGMPEINWPGGALGCCQELLAEIARLTAKCDEQALEIERLKQERDEWHNAAAKAIEAAMQASASKLARYMALFPMTAQTMEEDPEECLRVLGYVPRAQLAAANAENARLKADLSCEWPNLDDEEEWTPEQRASLSRDFADWSATENLPGSHRGRRRGCG